MAILDAADFGLTSFTYRTGATGGPIYFTGADDFRFILGPRSRLEPSRPMVAGTLRTTFESVG